MTGEFGVSFAPTGKNEQQQDGGAASTPIQDAIKVLSLRIPQFVGARGVAPQALMGGAGSAGVPGGAPGAGGIPGGLDDFLRRLFGQMGMGGGMAPMGGPPTPNIVPGGEAKMPSPPSQEPIPGGVVKPGTFSPSPSSERPTMGGPRPPMQRLV